MSAIRVKVPEDRVVTLKLPANIPIGDVELEVSVRQPIQEFVVELPPDDRPRVFPQRPTHPKLAAEHDAFQIMLPDLMSNVPGKYVAIHEGRVVAVGDSEVDARTSARATVHDGLVLVRLVTDQPQPIPRIASPRVVREK